MAPVYEQVGPFSQNTMEVIITALAYILSGLSLLMSVLFLIHSPRLPFGFIVMLHKPIEGALSPYWAIMGVVGAVDVRSQRDLSQTSM